jgi:hypothetical protein
LLNFLHGALHLIQFIQSLVLVAYSVEDSSVHDESWIYSVLHHPFFAFFWAAVGILTFVIGIRDYRHHKKCDHEHAPQL